MAALNFPDQPSNGQEYSANGKTWVWDGTSWKLKYVTTGSTTFVGLSDTASSLTANKWIKVNAAGTALELTDAPSTGGTADGNTTYTQSSVSDGSHVRLRLSDSSSPVVNDDILISAGDGIQFQGVSAAGFTIKSTATGTGGLSNVVEDTTPQLGGNLDLNSQVINGTGSINFSGTLITRTDDVSNVVQTSLKIGRVQNLDSFIVKADGNVTTIGMIESTGFKKTNGTSSQFLKADGSVDSTTYITGYTNTTYTLPVAQNGTSVALSLVPVGGSANPSNQTVQLIAGNDIELLTQGTSNSVIIKSTASTGNNTTYAMSAEDGSAVERKAIRLTSTNPAGTQDLELQGGTNITLTRTGNIITITGSSSGGSGSDGNTTYGVSVVDGGTTDQKLIRLSSADPAGTDDITVEEGDNVTITRTGDKLTFASSSSIADATDVDYEGVSTPADNKLLQFSSGKWRLEDSVASKTYTITAQDGSSNDEELIRLSDGTTNTDITIKAGNYIGVSRTSNTIEINNQATLAGLLDTNYSGGIGNGKILKYSTSGGSGGTGAWILGDDANTEYSSFNGTGAGLVPNGTSAGSTKFLRSDGDWVDAPAPSLDTVLTTGNTSTRSVTVGNTTVADLNVTSNDITLNSDFTGSSPSSNVSLKVERGTAADVSIRWNEGTDRWQFTNDGSTFTDIGGSSGIDLTPYVKKTEAASLTLERTGSSNYIIVNTESYFDVNADAQITFDTDSYFKVESVGQVQFESDQYFETRSTRFDIKNQGGNTLWARINGSGLALDGGLIDKDGGLGAAGEILSSTGSKIEWISSPAAVTLDKVLENGNTSNRSMTVGNITCATLNITSPTVNLNSDFSGSTPSENISLKVERGNSADVDIRWNESSDKWEFTNDGSSYSDLGGAGADGNDNDYVSSATLDTYTLKLTRSGSSSLPQVSADLSGLRGITIQEEGSTLATAATTLNFKGASVTASGSGATKEITIAAGGISGITVQEEGSALSTAATTLNFKGTKVTATGSGTTKEITIAIPNFQEVTNIGNTTTNAITVGNLTCAALNVTSSTINLNSDFSGSTPFETCYLKVERGNYADVNIRWNESSDKWEFTNDGSSYSDLGGGTDTNYYLSGASWSSSSGQLTLNRSGGVGNLTLGISNLQTYFDNRYSQGGISISGSPSPAGAVIRWNGSSWEWSRTALIDGGTSSNNTNLTVYNNTSGYGGMEIEADGEVLLKKAGTSWREGGHLQFQDESFSGNAATFAIDVYNNTGSSSDSVIRVIDQASGTQRFCVNHAGAWGIGHTSPDYGSIGQVMISRGATLTPVWGSHSSISGSSVAQAAKADADIDDIYNQLNAIGEDDTIITVAQIKERLRALVRS